MGCFIVPFSEPSTSKYLVSVGGTVQQLATGFQTPLLRDNSEGRLWDMSRSSWLALSLRGNLYAYNSHSRAVALSASIPQTPHKDPSKEIHMGQPMAVRDVKLSDEDAGGLKR